MKEQLQALQEKAIAQIQGAANLQELQDIRVTYLGKKGEVTSLLKGLGKLSPEERPAMGALVNTVRVALEEALDEVQQQMESAVLAAKLEQETIDITLPGRPVRKGHLHPLTKINEEIEQFFVSMGYAVEEGPEIESDYFNFECLNLAADHPARDMQDSFYITDSVLLRTHTSPGQARTLQGSEKNAPIRMIAPGKVYRWDYDATHSPVFHQVEGLVIDKHITMSDLKGTLSAFAKEMFGEDREVRLRPSYFPFTEPSLEVDISCFKCGGEGCSVCKGTGWIEVLGSGMVHPNVLEAAGVDSTVYGGFAFGLGQDRIAMLKYGIDDIRSLYTNDVRFLSQFTKES